MTVRTSGPDRDRTFIPWTSVSHVNRPWHPRDAELIMNQAVANALKEPDYDRPH